jgi:recombination endonuclease VII
MRGFESLLLSLIPTVPVFPLIRNFGEYFMIYECGNYFFLESKFVEVKDKSQHKQHMPHSEFMTLLDFKGWQRCHICTQQTRLKVDHVHSTMWIRGLLCPECNALLGLYEHDLVRILDSSLEARMDEYRTNWPAFQLGIHRKYNAYYPEQHREVA